MNDHMSTCNTCLDYQALTAIFPFELPREQRYKNATTMSLPYIMAVCAHLVAEASRERREAAWHARLKLRALTQ